MASLKSLVDEFGFGVAVDNDCSFDFGSNPFIIVSEYDETYYNVKYLNAFETKIMKECEDTNDYHKV